MIFSIREGLRETLTERGYPVEVDCGAPRPMLTGSSRQRHRVVVMRDRDTSDAVVDPPRGTTDLKLARMVAYVVMVYAFAPTAGAMSWEHDIEADKLVDAVIVALYDWTIAQKAWRLELGSGRMLRAEEMQGTPAEALPLSAYELRFRIARGVSQQMYDGSVIYETGDFSSVDLTTEISLDGEDYEEVD